MTTGDLGIRTGPIVVPATETAALQRLPRRRTLPAARRMVFPGKALDRTAPDRTSRYVVKRGIDIVLATLAIILLSPLLIAIATAIRLTSPGPALFAQDRWGARRRRTPSGRRWEARVFRCLKFRTMEHNADQSAHQRHVAAFVGGTLDGAGAAGFKLGDDPRVTAVGQFLRSTSLDELPQLFNVLRGEMSLVGPRPVPTYEVLRYPGDWCLERLTALPGITGPWQVAGRSRVSFEEMMRMDLDYVRHPSIGRDLRLILMTIPSVLMRRGAR